MPRKNTNEEEKDNSDNTLRPGDCTMTLSVFQRMIIREGLMHYISNLNERIQEIRLSEKEVNFDKTIATNNIVIMIGHVQNMIKIFNTIDGGGVERGG